MRFLFVYSIAEERLARNAPVCGEPSFRWSTSVPHGNTPSPGGNKTTFRVNRETQRNPLAMLLDVKARRERTDSSGFPVVETLAREGITIPTLARQECVFSW